MTTYYRPIFVSEEADPDHGLDDCVWTAGLMEANAASGGTHPATLAEAEALELAGGGPFPLGSTSQELAAGTTKRYGWAAQIEDTPAAILSALQPGRGATVSGKPGLLPSTSPFRRWTGTGDYGHRVYIEVTDGPTYWLMDPLAPPNVGYQGQARWPTSRRLRPSVRAGRSLLYERSRPRTPFTSGQLRSSSTRSTSGVAVASPATRSNSRARRRNPAPRLPIA